MDLTAFFRMHPDLKRLLSRNDPPTDVQIREAENLLDIGLKELSELDDTILKLSLVLSELRFQKRCRTSSLSALKGVLAPIRRVPPETLGEIFQWCCRTNWMEQHRSITNVRAPPLLLGHVCSLWRTVSQNTPRLWRQRLPILCFHAYPGHPTTYRPAGASQSDRERAL
ncbi:hypothetical protein B0H16DRAFT_1417034 [Mycena metata]|uniref:F-box domain-containing protein n=1 Tax=Mycena metata TaxID=1033252 RepID=A0AAD7J431_9AGAR|nr:hypothetical protein B0H16DRAFT_1417034 [Mycena metata]